MGTITEAEYSQRSIVKWCYDNGSDVDVKSVLSCFPIKHLGRWAKIGQWFMERGPAYTTDFVRFVVENKMVPEWSELMESSMFCTDPYKEAKILCRIALGEAKSGDMLSVLKEYESAVERIEEARIGAAAKKYSGQSVLMEIWEDICERIESGDHDSLSGYSW